MSEQGTKANFFCVAFYVPEKPPYFNAEKPGLAAIQLAQEMFTLPPSDFNPKHGGRYYGHGKYGYTFEVQVKWESAQALSVRNIPEILNIFE